MPEEFEGQHLDLSSELLDPKQVGRGLLILGLFLLSNNLIFNEPDIQLSDKRVLEIFNESGWNNDKYLPILISSPAPTASAIAEKLFATALRFGDLKTVKKMLKARMNPNTAVTVMEIVLTPLEYASMFADDKSVELVLLFLAYGADVNFSYGHRSALNNAIISRHDNLIRLLLTHGAVVTASCLFSAITSRTNDDNLRELIDACPNWNKPTKRRGSSFFAKAVVAGRVAIARLLLTRGAEVNEFIELDFEGEAAVTTALGVAVRSTSLEMIRIILDVCDNVNPDVDGLDYVSPLTLAVELGDSQITEMLLRAGVNVEAADYADSSTLMRRATKRKKLALCQVLIKYGARIDEQVSDTEQESSALLVAIQKKAFDIVDLLINEHARLNDTYSETPGTILGAAIELGDQALINKLLSAGARIIREDQIRRIWSLDTAVYLHEIGCFQRILDTSGQQILAGALMARDESLIQYLLEHHADLRGSAAEYTPLRASIETGNLSSTKALLDRGAMVTDGDLAAALNVDTKCFQELLRMFSGSGPTTVGTAIHNRISLGILRDAGVNPTGIPVFAWTIQCSWMQLLSSVALEVPISVLEVAVAFGSEKDLKLLLQWARWDKRLTGRALTVAIFLRRDKLVGELLKYGSDGEQEICIKYNYYGRDGLEKTWIEHFTPLQAAAKNQLFSAAEKLVQDVDVNYLGEGIHRHTALQHAVENGDIDLMNLLLRHGARVDGPPARDRGATALQIAAIRGYIGIARRLIDLGACVNEPPAIINGRTALEGAAEHGRLDMLQMLLDEGALVVGDGEKHYQQAIQLAERHGHGAAARLLRSFRDSLQVTTSEAI